MIFSGNVAGVDGRGREGQKLFQWPRQTVCCSALPELCGRVTHTNIHTSLSIRESPSLRTAGLPQELTKHSAASSMKPSWKRCSSLKVSAKAWRRLSEGRARSRLCWNWEKMPWRGENKNLIAHGLWDFCLLKAFVSPSMLNKQSGYVTQTVATFITTNRN